MQRQGWTFCLGLLACGLAAAQPPADAERYPPAPDLPGVIVGQTIDKGPAGTVVSKKDVPVIAIPAETPSLPAPTATELAPVPAPIAAMPAANCGAAGTCNTHDGSGCFERFVRWHSFLSRSKQRGCYPSPYKPDLYAWFVCTPCARPVLGSVSVVPGAPTFDMPPPITPPGPPAPAPQVLPGTRAEPKGPPRPIATVTPRADLLPAPHALDAGLSFTPGVAPMAKPTTQTGKVSNWRPR